jgi:GDPmannose 4,6-dehydratase
MHKKKALIFGVTGQDGSYLAEFLLKKGYVVHGTKRKSSSFNTQRIDNIFNYRSFFVHYNDLTDSNSVLSLIELLKPDEIYNLSAQSHVATSFEMPLYTSDVNALGTLRVLEAIKNIAPRKKIKFYQASTSELFGKIQNKKQSENTNFYPLSPYATSKLFAYWITKNYRESYNIFASNGILFNHESPRRGETFVTKKITMGLAAISFGFQKYITLGNIYSKRDWGHAKDFVEAQWKILQQKKADDFVISTDKQYSVKYFFELCCKILDIKISWSGKKFKETAKVLSFNSEKTPLLKKNMVILKISKKYFRPNEVNNLIGDSSKAKKKFKWKSKHTIYQIAEEMIEIDYKAQKNKFLSLNL